MALFWFLRICCLGELAKLFRASCQGLKSYRRVARNSSCLHEHVCGPELSLFSWTRTLNLGVRLCSEVCSPAACLLSMYVGVGHFPSVPRRNQEMFSLVQYHALWHLICTLVCFKTWKYKIPLKPEVSSRNIETRVTPCHTWYFFLLVVALHVLCC